MKHLSFIRIIFLFLGTVITFSCKKKSDAVGTVITPPTGIIICAVIWQDKNLDVTNYKNGDPIPQITDDAQWNALTTGAWCYYNNDIGNNTNYGKLYNWYAVNDPRGLAPDGWHIPTDAEWISLTDGCLGGSGTAGGKLKSTSFLWNMPNTGADNSSGFAALPGGARSYLGPFIDRGNYGYWWTATQYTTSTAGWYRQLSYNSASSIRDGGLKKVGFSVRCVKD